MQRGLGWRVWCGRELGITGDPPAQATGCIVSRDPDGCVRARGAGTPPPGWVSRTAGSGSGAPEPREAAAMVAFPSLELDPSLCSVDAGAALLPPAPPSDPREGDELPLGPGCG